MKLWKPINLCSDYLVSNDGELKSTKRNREKLLAPHFTQDGYIFYVISVNGEQKTVRANRLVAEAFIPNPEGKKTVNHIDGNKLNNRVDNLEWATMSEQMFHAYSMGLKKPVRNEILTKEEAAEIRRTYKAHDKNFGMLALAKKYGVSQETIKRCAKGKTYKI